MLFEDDDGNVLMAEEFELLPDNKRWRFKKILYYEFCPLITEVI